jgi:ribosomal protein L29
MATLPTITEVRKMSVEDLRSEVTTVRREAARIRLGIELSKEKDSSQLKKLRKHLAQILTVLQEKNQTEKIQKSQTMQKRTPSESSVSSKSSKKSLSTKAKVSKIPAHS